MTDAGICYNRFCISTFLARSTDCADEAKSASDFEQRVSQKLLGLVQLVYAFLISPYVRFKFMNAFHKTSTIKIYNLLNIIKITRLL